MLLFCSNTPGCFNKKLTCCYDDEVSREKILKLLLTKKTEHEEKTDRRGNTKLCGHYVGKILSCVMRCRIVDFKAADPLFSFMFYLSVKHFMTNLEKL